VDELETVRLGVPGARSGSVVDCLKGEAGVVESSREIVEAERKGDDGIGRRPLAGREGTCLNVETLRVVEEGRGLGPGEEGADDPAIGSAFWWSSFNEGAGEGCKVCLVGGETEGGDGVGALSSGKRGAWTDVGASCVEGGVIATGLSASAAACMEAFCSY